MGKLNPSKKKISSLKSLTANLYNFQCSLKSLDKDVNSSRMRCHFSKIIEIYFMSLLQPLALKFWGGLMLRYILIHVRESWDNLIVQEYPGPKEIRAPARERSIVDPCQPGKDRLLNPQRFYKSMIQDYLILGVML